MSDYAPDHGVRDRRTFSAEFAQTLLRVMAEQLIGEPYPCVKMICFDTDASDMQRLEDAGVDVAQVAKSDSCVGYLMDKKKGGSVRLRKDPHMFCMISLREMMAHAEDGMVRDMDVVWAGKHICHEAQHLKQQRVLYQDPALSGRDLDMARIDAVCGLFKGYYREGYAMMPHEIDADHAALPDTVSYLEPLLVTPDGSYVVDVRACLMEYIRGMRSWHGDKEAENFEAMVDSLAANMDLYKTMSVRGVFDDRLDKGQARALVAVTCGDSWDDVLHGSQSIGVERSEELFAVLMDVSPLHTAKYACLDRECKRIRLVYPSRLPLYPDRIGNAVHGFMLKMDDDGRAIETPEMKDEGLVPVETIGSRQSELGAVLGRKAREQAAKKAESMSMDLRGTSILDGRDSMVVESERDKIDKGTEYGD